MGEGAEDQEVHTAHGNFQRLRRERGWCRRMGVTKEEEKWSGVSSKPKEEGVAENREGAAVTGTAGGTSERRT